MQAALDAAVADGGIVHALSYQTAPLEASGGLRRILIPYEPPPIPIHIVHPAGRHLSPKIRLFIDRALAALRGKFMDQGGVSAAASTHAAASRRRASRSAPSRPNA